MNSEKLSQVLKLLEAEKATAAQNIFKEIEPAATVEYFLVKGKIEQKFQNWGSAINAFSKVIRIDPENVEAKNHIKMIQSIINFWNPEMFNP